MSNKDLMDILSQELKKLAALEDKQGDIWLRMLRAYDSALFPLDLLAMAALNRSAALCAGFRSLIQQRNFICAASILRLQLDTALRFYAAFLVADPHTFASAVLKGIQINKLKDKSGEPLHDAYLVKRLSKEFPWVDKVYETTCAYIHFSKQHIIQAIESASVEDRVVEFKMSATDKDLPNATYAEAAGAFCAATEVLHHYIEGWIYTKANPDVVARLRKASQKKVNAK